MKRILRRAASLLLAAALTLASAQSVLADEAAAPAETADIQARTPLGYRIQPFETGYLLANGAQQIARRNYPRRYSLIAAGQIADVPFDQGDWNTAWAAGAIRSAEASLYKNGAYLEDPLLQQGLSTRHLAYFTYARGSNPADPADRTASDAYLLPQNSGLVGGEERFLGSGNLFMATAALARWSGAGYASLLPYPESWMFDPEAQQDSLLYPEYRGFAGVPDQTRFERAYQLGEARILPRYDAAGTPDGWAVKQAMLDGLAPALLLSYDPQWLGAPVDSGIPYCMPQKEAEQSANHVLTLVGWDDDIPASAFSAKGGQRPAGPGGWLARNVWGGEEEFLWISYYSGGLSDTFAFSMEPARFDHNYQIDGLGATGLMRASGSVSMANLFTAGGEERLDAVGFYTADHGVTARIQIYTGFTDSGDPTTGTPRLGQGQTELLAYAGYHTIALDRPVALAQGEPFAVVVSLSGGSQLHFFVEQSVEGYASASLHPGQSLLRAGQNGGWVDLASGEQPASLCVKAFTTDLKPAAVPTEPAPAPSPSPSGMSNLLAFDAKAAAELALPVFEEAARMAKQENRTGTTAPVTLTNYTDLLPEGRDAILRIAQEVSERSGVEIDPWILADTVENGQVLGRLYLDPSSCVAPLRLGAYPDDPAVQAVFEDHFSNPVRTIQLMQQGEFGGLIGVALAADLVGLLPDRLMIYRYNPEANSYRLAEDVSHSIDELGYLRLILPRGGCYIVADHALEPR